MPKRSHDTDDSEPTGQEIIPKKMFNCGEIAAQTKLLPFASKYQFIDKRYRFKKRWINGCQCMDFPLSQNIYEQPCGYGRLIPKPNPPVPSNEFTPVKKRVPDLVLLNIFKYMHPIDLINGVSKVSKRWNQFAKTKSFYRNVRVLVNDQSPEASSAKRFLELMKDDIRRLALVYQNYKFFDVLPDCMPNVTTLDIAHFPEFEESAIELASCFPAVEVLNLYYANIDRYGVHNLLTKRSFKRLRQFYFNDGEMPENLLDRLDMVARPIQLLCISNTDNLNMITLRWSKFVSTLTELYLNDVVSGDDFGTIGTLTNLKTLEIDVSMYATPDQFMQLKSLKNLEHIHLDWSCCRDLKAEHLARLFELPSENASSYFPYRLKYLRLWNCPELLQMVAVKAIINSCPQLISLNISRDDQMGEEAFALLLKNLSNLHFLDISCLYKMRCDAFYELTDDDLPKLEFLILHDTEIDQKFLENLNLKRPKLMISNRREHFINWDLKDGKQPCFNEDFAGDLNAILNDLSELDGFCCMHSVI